MRQRQGLKALLSAALAVGLSVAASMVSLAAAKAPLPFELVMDVNSRPTPIYDGYSQYVDGYRASAADTFHVAKTDNQVDLNNVTMDYAVLTFDEEGTIVSQECTVYGVSEDQYYPIFRQETLAREEADGELYDVLNRSYRIRFTLDGVTQDYYFTLVSDRNIGQYRNVIKGKWEQANRGYRYLYEEEPLKSWVVMNGKWYFFGDDGYMRKGWQQYKGDWYYLSPQTGEMLTNCTVGQYQLDANGVRIEN